MIEQLNNLLENNDVMVRCFSEWYRLESIHIDENNGTLPIIVSDDDGGQREFDMADIEEFEQF